MGAGLAPGATGFLLATAKGEEAEKSRHFGPAYGAYMGETKLFFRFLF